MTVNRREMVKMTSTLFLATKLVNRDLVDTRKSNSHNSELCGTCKQNGKYSSNYGGLVPDDEETVSEFTVESTNNSRSDDVNVYWVTEEAMHSKGYPFAYGVASVGGNTIILADEKKEFIGHGVLHHELAHCLGYRHSDDGIMNYRRAERNDHKPSVKIAESTRETAKVFEGMEYLDWDIQDLGYMGIKFARGDINISRLGYGGQRFASVNVDDVFYTSDYDMFGNHKDDVRGFPDDEMLIKTNMYYGTPV